jgi:predicted 3-demethylubiquinone-9 3-methyltransferase (glyoxalase superfamily)
MSEPNETQTNIQKITPFLWFDDNAEEAAKFYTSIFKNSRVIDITHYGESAAEVSGRPSVPIITKALQVPVENQLTVACCCSSTTR